MTRVSAHRLTVALIASTILGAGSLAVPANAQEQAVPALGAARQFNIGSQPLQNALIEFGQQARVQVSVDPALIKGISSPGVNGALTTKAALDRLISGSGLRYRFSGANTILIDKATGASDQASSDATALQPIVLQSKGATTEGSGLYTGGATSTGTGLPLSLKETPQSVSVATRQQMDDQKTDSVREVLENTVGVTSLRQGIGADLDQFLSRGFYIENYLIDGVPTNISPTSTLGQNTAMFDRVEVLRGAAGLTTGMGTPAGAVNLVRKRPTDEKQFIFSSEVGNWNRYGGQIDLSGPLTDDGGVRSRLVIDHKDQDSWIDRYHLNETLIYGITEFDIGDSSVLSVGGSYNKNDNDSPMRTGVPLKFADGTAVDFSRSFNIAPDWSYYNNQSVNVFTSLQHEFESGWTGKVELSHTNYKYDAVSGYLNGSSLDRTTGQGAVFWPVRWQSDDNEYALNSNLAGKFDLFGREHDLVVGTSLSRLIKTTPNYGGFMGPWTGFDGTIDNIYDWDGTGLDFPDFVASSVDHVTESQYSAYANARFSLTDDLSLFTGGRLTRWSRDTKSRDTSTDAVTSQSQGDTVPVPYAALVYGLTKEFSVYGSYTKIFNPVSSGVIDVSGRPLDPDEGTSYELGTKAALLNDSLNVRTSLFYTNQDNLAVYDNDTGAYRSLKGTTSRGFEIEATGEITDGWNVIGGYTFTIDKDKDGKPFLTHLPRHQVKLWTTYKMPGVLENLTIGGGMNWQSETGYDLTDSVYPVQSSFAVFNLMARYDFSKHLTGTVNLNNVFDKKYYAGISDWGIYGAPRNVMVSLKAKF